MRLIREGDLEIDLCPECLGLWFDGEELRRFLTTRDLAGEILDMQATQTPRRPPACPPGERLCPRCSETLRETPIGAVKVDYCRKCRGIWLDHGELAHALQAYQAGARGNLVVLNQLAEGWLEATRRGDLRLP